MKDLFDWARSIETHKAQDRYVVADRCGWIPGSSRSRFGVLMLAARAYIGGKALKRIQALIANLIRLKGGCPDCGRNIWGLSHEAGCDQERCRHNLQAIGCDGEIHDRW